MSPDIQILDGLSELIRDSIGPEAKNREQDADADSDEPAQKEGVAEDSDRAESDYDSPACCSAASNTDLSVLES